MAALGQNYCGARLLVTVSAKGGELLAEGIKIATTWSNALESPPERFLIRLGISPTFREVGKGNRKRGGLAMLSLPTS